MTDEVPIWNLPYLEALYRQYLRDERSVGPDWRELFRDVEGNGSVSGRVAPPPCVPTPPSAVPPTGVNAELIRGVVSLIHAYRMWGHLEARLDPLGTVRPRRAELDPASYGLDLETVIEPVGFAAFAISSCRTVGDLTAHLRRLYCASVGFEYMHLTDPRMRDWIQEAVETNRYAAFQFDPVRALELLIRAEQFDAFVRKKYVGAKSFSLEGNESLIPLLNACIEQAAQEEALEVVLAMAHRGRLNVLVNVVGKLARDVFSEFEDKHPAEGHGDVKYHLGANADRLTASGRNIHISLCFNPSHLEFIDPVLCGRVRAKQDRVNDQQRRRAVGIQIHGDAAFAGEGVVQETLCLSGLPAFQTGGSLHIVVNNQIGFTTGPDQGRPGEYATDVAKGFQIPIFHVNGEDIEAVLKVTRMAMDFRREFARDVIIDLYGYRRLGHNEGDEPSFTQPTMYRAIEAHPPVSRIYADALIESGQVQPRQVEEIRNSINEELENELRAARSEEHEPAKVVDRGPWIDYIGGVADPKFDGPTGVPQERLRLILQRLAEVPPGFTLHPRLTRLMERRQEMAAGKRPLDWATAEALAVGALALEGRRVRLTGQDTERGTFSQRHAVLHDFNTDARFEPLNALAAGQARVEIYNSPLSEIGVLSFEYGYSLDAPEVLVMWEAQFGDFVNAAQVLIDQFLASAEAKWRRLSGLVLLLPHGFDGQGPEHSSARLERFLLLAVEDNIQVVNLTTPAQYFHVLRRQALSRWRKPLVIMTPKSLLRHPAAVSSLDELSAGKFEPFIGDAQVPPEQAQRLLLCTGKIYYELLEMRTKLDRKDVAIVRMEQLYPLPDGFLRAYVERLSPETEITWVQEEPENMGAWIFIHQNLGCWLCQRFPLRLVARPASSTPATGSPSRHKQEQEWLLRRAFEYS